MFVLLLKYLKPLDEVDVHRPAHLEFLERYYREKKFICSGRKDPPTGGVILANVGTEIEATKIICEDPYFVHGVAEYEAIHFTPGRFDPEFAPFVSEANA